VQSIPVKVAGQRKQGTIIRLTAWPLLPIRKNANAVVVLALDVSEVSVNARIDQADLTPNGIEVGHEQQERWLPIDRELISRNSENRRVGSSRCSAIRQA
jgi:hypothetical protein